MNHAIDFAIILSSDPSVEKLRWALSNQIRPSTELEAKLVRRLAHHLWGLRDIPEINDALFPWLRSLGHPVRSPDRYTVREICDIVQGDFLLGDFEDCNEEEISTAFSSMIPAFKALFSINFGDMLCPDEAVHVKKYIFNAQRLRLIRSGIVELLNDLERSMRSESPSPLDELILKKARKGKD